jgi:hypothetical protein
VIKRDFIERQIEEFARALARFLKLREEKQVDEARAQAGNAARELTGHELSELVAMPAALFTALGPERQRQIAKLLVELAKLERGIGRLAEAEKLEAAAAAHRGCAEQSPDQGAAAGVSAAESPADELEL